MMSNLIRVRRDAYLRVGYALILMSAFSSIGFAGALWWVTAWQSKAISKPIRIGYNESPPQQYVRADGSPAGPLIELLSEAGRRRNIVIEWVKSTEGPEKSLAAGQVDLWPLLGDLPERRSFLYFSEPWTSLSFHMVSLETSNLTGPMDTAARVVVHGVNDIERRLASSHFPRAKRVALASSTDVLKSVCSGTAIAGLIPASGPNAASLGNITECARARLRLRPLEESRIPFGIAASRSAAVPRMVADLLREEIGIMAKDGTLSSIYFRWHLDANNESAVVAHLTELKLGHQYLLCGIGVLIVLTGSLAWQTARVQRARAAADEASVAKSEFLANMSHEIRTPLNGVMGMIHLVSERCTDEEASEHLRHAGNAAQHLTSILNDILDLSKLEAGKLRIERIPFNLYDEVGELMSLFAISAGEKRIVLRTSISSETPQWVLGDAIRFRQILMNLVGNAVKFTSSGQVSVEVAPAGDDVLRINVIDTGIGIAPDKLQAVFEPFTQADESHTRRFGGTGLGLTITRRLTHLMRGHACAESAIGKGSIFRVELPLPRCEPPLLDAETVGEPVRPLGPLHILVAEDNLINQKLVSALLKRQGWTMTFVANGQEACDLFQNTRFDVVLMDVQMPGMDGLQATRVIRKKESELARVPTPIIAVTAHASASDHQQCIAAGMNAVLTKPFNVALLIETILKLEREASAATRFSVSRVPGGPYARVARHQFRSSRSGGAV
jgi:signal transduction histidine kinase/ActR/RegA family two-component response regulator